MELFDRIQHPDSLINRIQDKLVRVINAIARKPIVDGHIISGVLIDSVETKVEHGLGRVPQGWMIINGQSDVVEETADADDKFLYLIAVLGATLENRKLWVF